MKRLSPLAPDSEKIIRRLKEDNFLLRRLLISKLPPPIQAILESNRECEDRASVFRWLDGAAERLVEVSEKRPASEMGVYMGSGERAYCPLCGEGTRGPYPPEGFAWPEGLRRHLLGTYNSHQCHLMAVVKNAAIDDVEDEFVQHLRRVSKEQRLKRKR
jgi:hypothetical protein